MQRQRHSSVLIGLILASAAVWLGLTPRVLAMQGATSDDTKREDRQTNSSSLPPTHLKLVGDHWTPYDPPDPESFPEGSAVHIIVKGDTLWDLANHYLNDPFLWPQIWDANQYITDSHWIYPGDPLLIPEQPTVISEQEPTPAIELEEPPPPAPPAPPTPPAPPAEPAPRAAEVAPPAPVAPVLSPSGDETDIYCSSYIVDEYEEPALEIREREDGARTILGTGDIVFLNKGLGSSITPGDEFTVIAPTTAIHHPATGKIVGYRVRMFGRVRVIALQENTATGIIEQSCDAIEVGMDMVPFEEIPIPLATPVDFRRYGQQLDTSTAGYIVASSPPKLSLATGDIVSIDMGTNKGVRPGDVFTIFREWPGSVQFDSSAGYIAGQQLRAKKSSRHDRSSFAQTVLGQAVVLKAREHTSTAKIILAAREISLGDRVATR
ncbi:MAG: LysM peptidoglycan-binding domain-containing protein [Acidobacteriota bacterium]